MAIKTIRVFQEFTSAGYVPMPVAGNIDYGVTIANTFPATTPTTFQTDDPDIDVTLTATTDYYVWIRSHGTDWNPMYTRNVRVYPDSPLINNVVMGLIIANLDGTVPYTGATTNVNLGEHGLTTGYLNFDLTPSATPTTASTISWNEGNGTLEMVTLGGNVVHQIGQEILARAYNAETTTLNKGEIVYIHGAQGNRISVKRASSTLETTSSVTIGIVAETIPAGNEGFIMSQGTLGKLNTSALSQGTALWLGTTPGTYTSVKPVAPVNSVLIGYVERVHATVGSIYVKIQNGYELEELHNVLITSVANKNTLVYDSTAQVWKNRNIFGTQGYMPYYDDTLLMKDSVIYTNGTNVGISSTSLTEKLVVGGNILATAFKKVGGLSTEFLKADGSSDATAYQPLSADLTAIDNLALTTGLLRKNGSDNWELDQTEYLSVPIAISTYQTLANLSSNLTASTTKYPSVNAVNAGLALKLNLTGGTLTGGLTLNYSYPNIALSDVSSGTTWNIQNDGSTFKLNYGATNNFYIFSSGNAAFVNSLTASSLIKSGGTSTQFLKADGSVDNTNYQPYDADLASIAGLELTTGLLRKNGLNTYTLDQTEYVALSTANSTYQTLANLQSNLNASSTKYPSVNAVNTGLNLKLNLAGGTLTGDLALAYSYPNIQLNDTGSGLIWNIQNDGGGFEINSGITNKFVMYSSGNATFVNDLTANKFIKSGGTSSQFLMADGSVSSGNAGTVTSVGLSAPTGFSVSGSPVTTSGTLALAFSAGYSLPTISSQGNWDTAYNRSLTSIGVSGTTTKTLTLTKQDGSTLTASWSDINTDAVTSVFGRTGAIVATSGDYTTAQVTESGNLYYLDSRARASLSFVAGSGAYNSTTGVITIPTNTSQLTNGAGYITGITSLMVTNALGYTPVTNARTLTINGTTYDLSADRSWTISGTIGGLTSGYIPKATSASTLGNSLIYDNGTNIGIGTTSPASKLDISGGNIWLRIPTTIQGIQFGYSDPSHGSYRAAVMGGPESYGSTDSGMLTFHTQNGYVVSSTPPERMRLTSGGNLLVGTTTDSGYKLDVTGTGNFTGELFVRGNASAYTTHTFTTGASNVALYDQLNASGTVINRFNAGGNSYINGGNLGLGTSSPGEKLTINGYVGLQRSGTQIWHYGVDSSNSFEFVRSGISTRMILSSDGNLGLGVTPSAWRTSQPAFQIGTYTSLSDISGYTQLGNNYYTNSSNQNIYINSYFASIYAQNAGQHQWYTAPSGTAGTAISFTQAMTLDASGNLLIGNTASVHASSGRGVVEINGASTSILGLTINGSAAGYLYHGGTNLSVWNVLNGSMEFGTNNTTRLTITSGGNVGIGETSPTEGKLVINNPSGSTNSGVSGNTLYLKAQTANANLIRFSGAIATDLILGRFGNYDGISIGTTGGTEIARFLSSGNVLIGTTTDSGYKLDVNGTGRFSGDLLVTSTGSTTLTNSGTNPIFDFIRTNNATTPAAQINFKTSQGTFRWQVGTNQAVGTGFEINEGNGTANRFYIASGGAATFSNNVTLGNTSSSSNAVATFQNSVNGFQFGFASNTTQRFTFINGGGSEIASISGAGAATFSSSVTALSGIFGNSGSGSYSLRVVNNDQSNVRINIANTGAGGQEFSIIGGLAGVSNAGFSIYDNTNATTRLYINSSGNVGIGTTSPGANLVVQNSSGTSIPSLGASGGHFQLQNGTYGLLAGVNSAGNAWMQVQRTDSTATAYNLLLQPNGGNVGIGTSSPTERLDVIGAIQSTNGSVKVIMASQSTQAIAGTLSNHDYILLTYSGEKMRITSSGNVGIGTTNPLTKLEVNGDVSFKVASGNVGFSMQSGVNSFSTYINSADTSYRIYSSVGSADRMILSSAGAATFSSSVTATSFFESSDKTIKTLITDNYLVKGIESITAKLYTKHGKEELGYFAQDVQGILPSAVTKGTNGLLNLSYREVLVAKVQRLEKELEELKAKMN